MRQAGVHGAWDVAVEILPAPGLRVPEVVPAVDQHHAGFETVFEVSGLNEGRQHGM